jgi:hypothetical protein
VPWALTASGEYRPSLVRPSSISGDSRRNQNQHLQVGQPTVNWQSIGTPRVQNNLHIAYSGQLVSPHGYFPLGISPSSVPRLPMPPSNSPMINHGARNFAAGASARANPRPPESEQQMGLQQGQHQILYQSDRYSLSESQNYALGVEEYNLVNQDSKYGLPTTIDDVFVKHPSSSNLYTGYT